MVHVLLKAWNIPDSNVTLPTEEGGPTILRSCNKLNIKYTIFNPTLEWVCCTCLQTNREYICKHKLKVFRMLKPHIEEGSIARLCRSL